MHMHTETVPVHLLHGHSLQAQCVFDDYRALRAESLQCAKDQSLPLLAKSREVCNGK